MITPKFSVRLIVICLSVVFAAAVYGQGDDLGPVNVAQRDAVTVTGMNGLYCAGYIQSAPVATVNRLIGGNDEAEKYNYAARDYVYINMGSNKGVNVGDMFSVIRPRGKVNSHWTSKDLGFYVQEVGALEVVRVRGEMSVAKVKASCDSFLLGDLVQLVEKRVSPLFQPGQLDLFAEPSGKARGRVLMGRDNAEVLARNSIAYIDLGAEEGVKVGDKFVLFRALGTGNLMKSPEKEAVSARSYGYSSLKYKGGEFSNQASRKKGDKADGRMVTTYDAKQDRDMIRKIVGEAVVLNVKERTATVVITRNAQEIHTGDWAELQ